jgi:hypothetical protein
VHVHASAGVSVVRVGHANQREDRDRTCDHGGTDESG